MGTFPGKACEVCRSTFTPRRRTDKTCSLDCQIQWRRKLSRESVARRYQARPARPDTECESCKARVLAPRSGPMPRWCKRCRANRNDVRARKRTAVRRCYRCQTPVPMAERKPGKTVCDACRVDPRSRGQVHEQKRRLQKYGLTQVEYDELLRAQGERCAGCGTDNPGAKGWCIDHCHSSGEVRALLCNRCNTVLGLVGESVATLLKLANFLQLNTRV